MDPIRRSDEDADPTLVRSQPSLQTSSGRIWLIVGGLLAAVSLAVLIPLLSLGPMAVASFGIVSAVVLYVGMIAARLLVPPGRRRLGLMAACMVAMALITLFCVAIVASTEWSLLTGID